MGDQGQDANYSPHILVAYKRYRNVKHVKVVILGKGEAETPIVKWICMSPSIASGGY
jgi:hypothetical protein